MKVSLRRIRSHWIMIALAAVVFVLLSPIQAQAAFQKSISASTGIGSATLNPVLSATASNASCTALASAPNATVSWTMSATARATGYRVTATLVGTSTPQTTVTVSNPAQTSVPVSVTRSLLAQTSVPVAVTRSLLGLTNNYTFQVQVLYNNWTSTAVTTNATNCPYLGLG